MAYWVTFEAPVVHEGKKVSAICVDAQKRETAERIAEAMGPTKYIDVLPYPANPRVNGPNEEAPTWKGEISRCPSFCYTPKQCKGRSSCPKDYACSE